MKFPDLKNELNESQCISVIFQTRKGVSASNFFPWFIYFKLQVQHITNGIDKIKIYMTAQRNGLVWKWFKNLFPSLNTVKSRYNEEVYNKSLVIK